MGKVKEAYEEMRTRYFRNEPDEFAKSMQDIWDEHHNDPEVCHALMDDLMCETFERFGFGEGIKIFKESVRFYA